MLHYHALASIEPGLDPHNLAVEVRRFRSHLASLSRRGYEFLTAAEFAERLAGDGPRPGMCALTFDDGTVDNAEHLPVLLGEFGARATVYVCPGLLGDAHPDFGEAAGIRLMTADELRRLSRVDGIEIGAHTNEHVVLGAAGADEAFAEMSACKESLESLIGTTVRSFAYPSCAYSAEAPGAAVRAGYTSAVTCGFRGSWDPFELKRESITSLDGRVAFALKSRELWTPVHHSPVGRLGSRIRWGPRPSGSGVVER